MKTVLLITSLKDRQTGVYIKEAFENLGWKVIVFDYIERLTYMEDKSIPSELTKLVTETPLDLFLSIKGMYVSTDALMIAKERKIPTACWMFDVTLSGTPLDEINNYVELLKCFDTFYWFCDEPQKLLEKGVNVKQLCEGYSEKYNGTTKEKLNLECADVVFCGSMGYIFGERLDYLKRISDEGFDFKIYGNVLKGISDKLHYLDILNKHHQKRFVTNEEHSFVCQNSKICIGLSGWPEVKDSFSARVYRTLACGGFYLCRHIKGIENYFTPGIHLDTFHTQDEMVEKIKYYLEHDEERQKIAKAGMEKVKEYTFEKRIEKEFGRGDI